MNLSKLMFLVTLSFLITALLPVLAQQPFQGKWTVVIRHSDFGEMRMKLDVSLKGDAEFRAMSHRKGVRNLVGGFKASSAKLFAKKAMLRTGSLCQIEDGTFQLATDKTIISGTLNLPMSSGIKLEGTIQNGKILAAMTNKKGRSVGILEGALSAGTGAIDDYPAIVASLLETYNQRIYDKRVLQTPAFQQFAKKMTSNARKAKDDLDLVAAFSTYSKNLPFSHTGFFRMEGDPKGILKARFQFLPGQVSLEEKSETTVVLRVKSFRCPARDMDSVMQIVLAKGYQNLIVDIRGNSGGSLEGGITLSKYLVKEETPTGVYLTQKWFNEHPLPPTELELAQRPAFTKADVLEFLNTLDDTGIVVLKAAPGPERFEGKLFLLVDNRSASACEPLAWNLKHTGRAILVGEHTAGAMLSASTYPVRNGFCSIIPNGDYYTPTGERWDKVGVAPNIAVASGEALAYVLRELVK